MENKIFHIVYKEKPTDHMSKGVNVTGINMTSAIYKFGLKHHNNDEASIIAVYDINALADIKGGHPMPISKDDLSGFLGESND